MYVKKYIIEHRDQPRIIWNQISGVMETSGQLDNCLVNCPIVSLARYTRFHTESFHFSWKN